MNLGKPVGIRLLGGAVDLSTNGIHDLDLCCDILETTPNTVFSDLEIDNINPREKV